MSEKMEMNIEMNAFRFLYYAFRNKINNHFQNAERDTASCLFSILSIPTVVLQKKAIILFCSFLYLLNILILN